MNKLKVLVTGSSGYIGTHIVNYFQKKGFEVHTLDRNKPTVKSIKHYLIDLEKKQSKSFEINYDCVIHLASYTLPRESFEDIDKYLIGNLSMTNNLLKLFPKYKKFIFVSTANLYKPSKKISESSQIEVQSPYAESKLMIEKYLFHTSKILKSQFGVFRLFNAAGADITGEFRYKLKEKNKLLIPALFKCLNNDEVFYLNGNNYDTKDGTCIRDFIHVYDIAQAFEKFIKTKLKNNYELFNLGSSLGYSVAEVISKFQSYSSQKIKIKIIKSKKGDPSEIICDNSKIRRLIKWNNKYSKLEHIIKSSMLSFKI